MSTEKRAHQRFHAEVETKLFFGNMFHAGQVTNLSEGGLFVSTAASFPIDSVFVTVMLLNDYTLNMLSKVKRTVRPEDLGMSRNNFGMGLELLNPPEDYSVYLRSYQSSLRKPLL